MELIKFIFLYSLLIISVIGYGLIFSKKITSYNNFDKQDISLGYIGLFGIFFLIFISYLTNLIIAHNSIHNIIIILLGVLIFINFNLKKKIINRYFLLSYTISFFSIFYFKNHDDFSYYHLSFINNITENKIEFGIHNFDIAFNHVSSLFHFHSLFKTPLTKDFFYQIGQLSTVVFVNTILFENIFNKKNKDKLNLNFFLSIFFLIFINIFFYRLAEHGTDRSAQILFFLIFTLSISIFLKKKLDKSIFEKLIIIFTLVISLKSFYVLYLVLFFLIYFKFFKIFEFLKFIKIFPIVYLCFFTLILMLIYNVASSGCFLYPVAFTCPDTFFWGYGKKNVHDAMQWYEIWSKAGASPSYRVVNFSEYLSNFNWVSNWIDNYFFNKMFDFLLGLLFAIFFVLSIFKIKTLSFSNFKNLIFFNIILLVLIFEWFTNHPSLRYGGYVLIFLILVLPVSILLENQKYNFKEKSKSIKILVLIIICIFASRNVSRLIDEHNIYNYNFLKKPFYNLQNNFFTMKNRKQDYFYDIKVCEKENSKKNIMCKSIGSYKFYYKTN